MSDFEDLVSGVDAGLHNPCVVSFSAQPNDRKKEISIYPVKTQMEIPYGGTFTLNVSLDLTQTLGGKPEDYEISYDLLAIDYVSMESASVANGTLEKKEVTPKDKILAQYTGVVEVSPDTTKLTPIPVSSRRGKLFLVVSVRRIEDGSIKKITIEGHILRNSEYDNAILDTGSAFREAVAKALMQNGNLVVGENATVTDDESGVMKFRTNIDGEDVYAELYFVVDDSGGVQIKFAYKGKDSEEVSLHEADLLEMMSNAKGKDGKSAYDLWIEAGNEGTVDDFLNSLIGPQGPEGPKGDPGDNGETGATGADGKSAYDIWLENGGQGSESDFLASLKGDKGDKGDTGDTGAQGNPGAQGEPGESAYDIWVAQGGVGDEAAFLSSLKGDKGDTGEQGPPGADGTDGSPGVIISITGQTITDPSSVNMGDELVFSTDSEIAIDTVLSTITSQIAIGWTVKNTGADPISVTNGGEEIASVDAGSSVSGKWIRTSDGVYISVFKRALGEEGNDWITLNDAGEAVLNFPEETNDLMENISLAYNQLTKITGNVGGKLNCVGFAARSNTLTYVDIVANKAEAHSICVGCPKLTYGKIVAENTTSLNSLFQSSLILEAYIYTPNATNGLYILPTTIKKVTLHWGKFKTINFSKSSTNSIPNITDIIILSGGLASCTSFKIPDSTNLTDESIQNIIDALPDYSAAGTSALVSFPPGRLTAEQQTQITNKGWAWS